MKIYTYLVLCFIFGGHVNGLRDTLTPRMEATSFTNEQKRLTEDLVLSISQSKNVLLDEFKRAQGIAEGNDKALKTDLVAIKNDVLNNQKKHASVITHQLLNIYTAITVDIPRSIATLLKYSFDNKASLALLTQKICEMDTKVSNLKNVDDNIFEDVKENYRGLVVRLDRIEHSLDTSNTDFNSPGANLKALKDMAENIEAAINSFDNRGGIVQSDSSLGHKIDVNFASLQSKLEGIAKLEVSMEIARNRLETLVQKISEGPKLEDHIIKDFPSRSHHFHGHTVDHEHHSPESQTTHHFHTSI